MILSGVKESLGLGVGIAWVSPIRPAEVTNPSPNKQVIPCQKNLFCLTWYKYLTNIFYNEFYKKFALLFIVPLDYRQKTFLTNSVSSNNIFIAIYSFFLVCGIVLYLILPTRQLAVDSTEIFVIILSIALIWRTIGWTALYLIPVHLFTLVLEMIGANTGLLFGHYDYTGLWKLQVFGTPLAIGLLWILVSICSWSVVGWLQSSLPLQSHQAPQSPQPPLSRGGQNPWVGNLPLGTFWLVTLASLLATGYDVVLEQVAIKLGYWTWLDNTIPLTNYLCWFLISMITIGYLTRFPLKPNAKKLGVIVFVTTLIYFLILIIVN